MSAMPDLMFVDEQLSVAAAPVMLNQYFPRRHPGAFGCLGSIFIRANWKAQPGLSGLGIVAPPFPGAQSACVTLLTDDSVPPATGGAQAAGPPSLTLPTVQKKMEGLKGKWELLIPNFLNVSADGAAALGDRQVTVKVGEPGALINVKARAVDYASQTVSLVPADAPDEVPRNIKFSLFLRSIVLGATGARAWDGHNLRSLASPPEGVEFRPLLPPPVAHLPPGPEEPIVDLSEESPMGDVSLLRTLLTGSPTFGAGTNWARARFHPLAHVMQGITSSMPLTFPELMSMDTATINTWTMRADAILTIKFKSGVVLAASRRGGVCA